MLVLSRKANECVVIGSNIRIHVLEAHHDRVKLGFTGPREIPINREEVLQRIRANERAAACAAAH